MKTNKILVIGNGFDLAHELPTKYADFLSFCKTILDNPDSEYKKAKLFNSNEKHLNEEQVNTITDLINGNILFNYLCKKSYNDNWCDFEEELYNILYSLNTLEIEFENSNVSSINIPIEHIATKVLLDLKFVSLIGKRNLSIKKFNNIKNKILNDFYNLCLALEIYINLKINNNHIDLYLLDIVNFNPDHVISFNYSNTYERHYLSKFRNIDIHYIHGKAKYDKDNKYANIILGISSNFDSEAFIPYEKYYQRIVKRTGNKYKKWLISNTIKEEQVQIMFFGHSLDPMDKDIIIDLVESNNTEILIYYNNDESEKGIVKNLCMIFGKEKIINYVYGDYPKIKLIKQNGNCKTSQGEWNIANDILYLNSPHLLNNSEVEEILLRINSNFKHHSHSYFYSQENTIKLYTSLLLNNFFTLESDDVINMCNNLSYPLENGNLKTHCHIEHYNLFKNKDIDKKSKEITSINKLIDVINLNNKKRYENDKKRHNQYYTHSNS